MLLATASSTVAATVEPAGRVVLVEGGASVFPPRGPRVATTRNAPIPAGSTIRTADGRMEVDLAPNSTLRLSSETEVELGAVADAWKLTLVKGRMELEVWGAEGPAPGVTTEFGNVSVEQRSLVLVTMAHDSAILDVRDGVAEVRRGDFGTLVTAPGRVILRRGTPSFATSESSSGRLRDDFRYWVEVRRDARAGERSRVAMFWEAYGRELLSGGKLLPCPWESRICFTPDGEGFEAPGEGEWAALEGGRSWVSAESWGWVTSHYGSWVPARGSWWWRPGTVFQWAPDVLEAIPAPSAEHPLDTYASRP